MKRNSLLSPGNKGKGSGNSRGICLFLPSLESGGAERAIINLAESFSRSGRDVDLVVLTKEGETVLPVPACVQVISLDVSRMMYGLLPLVRYLRLMKPDILVSALDHSNLVAIWAARLAGVQTRVVLTVHSLMSKSVLGPAPWRQRLIQLLAKSFYPMADAVVAVSKGTADDLARQTGMPVEKIHVIYNPIVSKELLESCKQSSDHPWFIPGAPPVILGVGRLVPVKDFPTLIAAFSEFYGEHDARLLILGEGPERDQIQRLIEDMGLQEVVRLEGFVSSPIPYIAGASVLVLSSLWEGFGNVVVEALACGTPVVATRCPGGVEEILKGGELGELVTVGDIHAMASAVQRALEHPPPRAKLRSRADDFRVSTAVERYLMLFDSLF